MVDVSSGLHVLVVVGVVALSHRPLFFHDGVLRSGSCSLSGPQLSSAESVVLDISGVAVLVHGLGEVWRQFSLAVSH